MSSNNRKLSNEELVAWQKSKATSIAIQNEGFMSAVLGNHPDWAKQIWEQPCLVMPSTVAKGTTYDSRRDGTYDPSTSVSSIQRLFSGPKEDFLTRLLVRSGGKSRGPGGQVLGGFMREIVGLFIFNPWLYWKQIGEKNLHEDKWRATMRTTDGYMSPGNAIRYNPITKLLFCVIKVFGSPLILVYFAVKFFYVFLVSLKLPEFGKELIGSLITILTVGYVGVYKNDSFLYKHIKYEEHPDGTLEPKKEVSYPFLTAIHYYLGMIIPFQITGSRAAGESYGKGGISMLILFFMIISAFIIIIGGLNIVVITLVFFAYMYKTIDSLKTSAMGSGGQGGN